jgi:L-fuconolactonase
VTEAADKHWNQNQVNEIVDIALEVFGPKRLQIGSDYPVLLVNSTLELWVMTFQEALKGLSPIEKEEIYHLNARQFYQLETI